MNFLALSLLGLLPTLQSQESHRDVLPEPEAAITLRELKHHVSFLASDELRGRAAGTADAVRAARYLARALEQAGTEPAGDDGSYLQAMNLITTQHHSPPRIIATDSEGNRETYLNGIGLNVWIRSDHMSTGYLTLRHVESAADLPSEPEAFQALFFDTSLGEALSWLEASGNSNAAGWGLMITAGNGSDGGAEQLPERALRVDLNSGTSTPRICDSVSARGAFLEALRAWRVESLQLSYDASSTSTLDYNVLGRIAGVGTNQHPELAAECIVFSAHYDHIGVVGGAAHGADHGHAQQARDLIYNGADDDASGTAAVLEMAQAFAAGPAPARTLIFLLAAGEEQGLLGTNYYLEHPAISLAKTVANLNYEMVGRPDELAGGFGKLWLTGFERSNLGESYQKLGLGVVPDPRLNMNYFMRSDNYAFAKRGIVAQTLSSYNSHIDYHQVSDEVDRIDFEHMTSAVVNGFRAAQLLADGSLSPEWLPGGKP